jgi:hypothetical protein
MTNIDRDVGTDDKSMAEFVGLLARGRFLILSCLPRWGFDLYKGDFK